jgi:hypothetical protein
MLSLPPGQGGGIAADDADRAASFTSQRPGAHCGQALSPGDAPTMVDWTEPRPSAAWRPGQGPDTLALARA